jgi:hypothetical protein
MVALIIPEAEILSATTVSAESFEAIDAEPALRVSASTEPADRFPETWKPEARGTRQQAGRGVRRVPGNGRGQESSQEHESRREVHLQSLGAARLGDGETLHGNVGDHERVVHSERLEHNKVLDGAIERDEVALEVQHRRGNAVVWKVDADFAIGGEEQPPPKHISAILGLE